MEEIRKEIEAARKMIPSEWSLGFMSGIAVGVSAVAVILCVLNFFADHRAVGEDGAGRAVSTKTAGTREARTSTWGHVSNCTFWPTEWIPEWNAGKPDLHDREGNGADVGDKEGRNAERDGRARNRALGLLPVYLVVDRTCGCVGAALGGLGRPAGGARVEDRDRKSGDGDCARGDVHGGDYSKGAAGAQRGEAAP